MQSVEDFDVKLRPSDTGGSRGVVAAEGADALWGRLGPLTATTTPRSLNSSRPNPSRTLCQFPGPYFALLW
jgi:hypothetical protein